LRLLVIDADERFVTELRRLLERAWPAADVVEHGTGVDDGVFAAVANGGFDAVLLGHPQRGERGFAHLEALCRLERCPPVILFAAKSDEFFAVDALKAGAASFFPKTQLQARRLVDVISAETANARCARPADRPQAELGRPSAAGRRLVEKIYSGELASVYLAIDDQSGEKYAFKVLRHVHDAGESGVEAGTSHGREEEVPGEGEHRPSERRGGAGGGEPGRIGGGARRGCRTSEKQNRGG
jgi:DNA-binding NarL/FixJ family response regulator